MKSVNGELTETKEEDGGEALKRINARRHCHYFSMEEKVRDRLVRLSFAVRRTR
ncbi:hypothetical protein HID58_013218, partial [Brassica napus]